MDVNLLRIVVTVISLATFIGIVRWAWSRANGAAFSEAAGLALVDDEGTAP